MPKRSMHSPRASHKEPGHRRGPPARGAIEPATGATSSSASRIRASRRRPIRKAPSRGATSRLGQRQLGRNREARFAAAGRCRIDPRLADGWIALGLVEQDAGSFETARADMPARPRVRSARGHAHLSSPNLDQAQGRIDAALEGYARAQALDATMAQTPYSRGHLFHKATGDLDAAIASYRDAIAMRGITRSRTTTSRTRSSSRADSPTRGANIDGATPRLQFEARRRRRRPALCPAWHDSRRRARACSIIAEQGLGDMLFFLRFAPRVREHDVSSSFRGDPRLHAHADAHGPLRGRSLAHEGLRERDAARSSPPTCPAAVRRAIEQAAPGTGRWSRILRGWHAMRARLREPGAASYIGLAWRAGSRTGADDSLLKELPLEGFAATFKGAHATWISHAAGTARRRDRGDVVSSGAPVHDLSAVNEDLEEFAGDWSRHSIATSA